MSDGPTFEFEMQYVSWDNDPYYVRWWDKARPATILAKNKAEAFTNLWAMLGPSPRGRFWQGRVVSVKQVER